MKIFLKPLLGLVFLFGVSTQVNAMAIIGDDDSLLIEVNRDTSVAEVVISDGFFTPLTGKTGSFFINAENTLSQIVFDSINFITLIASNLDVGIEGQQLDLITFASIDGEHVLTEGIFSYGVHPFAKFTINEPAPEVISVDSPSLGTFAPILILVGFLIYRNRKDKKIKR
ncbi:MAG: hypothetical protein GY828_06255 [Candidatus Gracilibacteria bacterium]|nr:hypothetical protein [Candidatus Gracilibacteria bacterium]